MLDEVHCWSLACGNKNCFNFAVGEVFYMVQGITLFHYMILDTKMIPFHAKFMFRNWMDLFLLACLSLQCPFVVDKSTNLHFQYDSANTWILCQSKLFWCKNWLGCRVCFSTSGAWSSSTPYWLYGAPKNHFLGHLSHMISFLNLYTWSI